MLLIARVLHVTLGILWVGAMVFNTFLLVPAMTEAGPDGAKVGAALMRRGLATIMPVVAVLTLLSGLWLYWRVIGFGSAAIATGRGLTFGLGGLSAIIAFVLGVAVVRPAMMRSVAQAAATATEADRVAVLNSTAAIRARSARYSLIVAWLLVFSAVAMSVGRYM